jgi:hypothetical protein
VGRNYGDSFAGNQTQAEAALLGNLNGSGAFAAHAKATSIITRDLSLNGASGYGDTGHDWFQFDLSSGLLVTVTVDPTGGTYVNGPVGFDCQPDCPAVEIEKGGDCLVAASEAGDLRIELHSALGLLASADQNPAGGTESIALWLGAGTYFVHVEDTGPNPSDNQIVQLYDLTIRAGSTPARPRAIAGLSKRVPRNTPAFFIGDIHSDAIEPGASIVQYQWDLNGDGAFEIKDHARPVRCYSVAGSYDVTLRVVDSNGRAATDTITVTVY